MEEVDRAVETFAAWLAVRASSLPRPSDYAAAFDALEAAPLRSGPVDWSKPVEGWVLW